MARLRVGACLSLSGKYARFGRQAACGLDAWRSLDGSADLLVEDDHSDRHTLEAVMAHVAAGPASNQPRCARWLGWRWVRRGSFIAAVPCRRGSGRSAP